jgi:hypothetical protein
MHLKGQLSRKLSLRPTVAQLYRQKIWRPNEYVEITIPLAVITRHTRHGLS